MRNTTEIQRKLISLGYLSARDEQDRPNDDGTFGTRSLDAYNRFRATIGKSPTTKPTMAELNADLFPEERPAAPVLKPNIFSTISAVLSLVQLSKGKNMSANWFSTFVASTAFKYILAMVATFIASKIGVDHASLEGILTQLIGVAAGVWGMYESSKSKIVVNGEKVNLAKVSPADQAKAAEIVAKHS